MHYNYVDSNDDEDGIRMEKEKGEEEMERKEDGMEGKLKREM